MQLLTLISLNGTESTTVKNSGPTKITESSLRHKPLHMNLFHDSLLAPVSPYDTPYTNPYVRPLPYPLSSIPNPLSVRGYPSSIGLPGLVYGRGYYG